MTKLAQSLRERAAAGEDFVKLQKEAFEAAGMKIESPTVNLPSVRHGGLNAGHAAVFDLKPGEVSQVINDAGGHYIYKLNSKTEIPIDQAEKEIRAKLQGDQSREMTEKMNTSFKVETNDAYFGPGMENYLLSLKPAPLRVLLRVTGSNVDRERGLKEIRETALHGHYLEPFAKLLLAVAALRDNNPVRARELLGELHGRFPDNELYMREMDRIDKGAR